MPNDTKAKAYVVILSWLGLTLLLTTLPFVPLEQWRGVLLFAILCGIAQSMPVHLFRSSAVSVSFAFTFAGLVLFGPVAAIWINLGSSLVSAFRPKRKPLHKMAFNISNHALAALVAGAVYLGTGGTVKPEQPVTAILPTLLGGTAYYITQTALLSAAIALTEQTSFVSIWVSNYRWSVFNFVGLAVIGLGTAMAKESLGLLGITILFIPLGIAWYSFRLYMAKNQEVRIQNEVLKLTNKKLEESYIGTIRALAAVVDVKDHYTHGHSDAAVRYAISTARELGLSEDEIAAVQLAAMFHDVGKIGIPDSILNKPSQLTDDEWRVIKEHPIIGAKLIQQIDSLTAVIPGILYHHERYDGRGYPNGLAGDRIPLSAQIIAVADAYQAMTSNRPYRKALGRDHALGELRRCAGTQFNPRVVDAFICALERGDVVKDVTLPSLVHLFHPQEVRVPIHVNH